MLFQKFFAAVLLLVVGGPAGSLWVSGSGCRRWPACKPPVRAAYAEGASLAAPRGARARTKSAGCVGRGHLPDPACTPGLALPGVTQREICAFGYSARVRNVSPDVEQAIYAAYGIFHHRVGAYELDHLIPLELGGSNDAANLWPQPAVPAPGFHEKDGVENALHDAVCRGAMSLPDAQRIMADDWLTAFHGRVSVLPLR